MFDSMSDYERGPTAAAAQGMANSDSQRLLCRRPILISDQGGHLRCCCLLSCILLAIALGYLSETNQTSLREQACVRSYTYALFLTFLRSLLWDARLCRGHVPHSRAFDPVHVDSLTFSSVCRSSPCLPAYGCRGQRSRHRNRSIIIMVAMWSTDFWSLQKLDLTRMEQADRRQSA
ncbi:hypothetical protein BV25DRAFT_1429553 [Artomyces pyxidatus]|uniref:Uncharacterized protein n=1 Tax=Artomyces pyxidatus TaxID=48021 RepID=A0ACB8SLW0_9AGAM|nr:hypothetical protein BV25DRAFT_1429553 [Artomyces pyxidatus]